MKKNENDSNNPSLEQLLRGKKIPILVLDQRWHKLFPGGRKPGDIVALEKKLNDLLKEQGKLVNEVKDLKKAKKKLMDAVVAGMNEVENEKTDRKKTKQQKLILETNERIREESDRLMELPYEIKAANEELMVVGITYCYQEYQNRTEELEDLLNEINIMREELKEKVAYRVELEESVDATYSLMHGLLGHEVMNLFDKKKI